MSVQVCLPPGCRSLRMEDGKRYVAPREGGRVTVSDAHARAINALPGNGTAGLVSAGGFYAAAGPAGRVCTGCGRIYYAFTFTCPRQSCGAATRPEQAAGG